MSAEFAYIYEVLSAVANLDDATIALIAPRIYDAMMAVDVSDAEQLLLDHWYRWEEEYDSRQPVVEETAYDVYYRKAIGRGFSKSEAAQVASLLTHIESIPVAERKPRQAKLYATYIANLG